GHLVEVDGHVVHTDLSHDLASKGVVLASLHDAIGTRPELVERYLATDAVPPEEGKFQALNAALWTDGI
ncbi:MAG: Fe-S cluster assembly protein SufD, partial [Thermoplasmata archaeon]|nr:Fe-S cluster assembly protein SufD [Thermoplasmata archaeon]NIW84914.1 Fe-S cluster assembly protein SufD [Thermoplasmata archaeon]